ELAYLVTGQDAVVDHDAVEGGACGTIGAQQAFYVELRVIAQALGWCEQVFSDRLLDTLQPGTQRESQEADHLLFDAGSPVAALVRVSNHPRRHAEPAADLFDAEGARFEHLGVFRVNAEGADLNASLEHCRGARVERTRTGADRFPGGGPLIRL